MLLYFRVDIYKILIWVKLQTFCVPQRKGLFRLNFEIHNKDINIVYESQALIITY